MELLVSRITHEAQGVRGIELRSPDNGLLPPFRAGAHIDLHLPGGLCRQYSLANAPSERDRYVIGVGLAPASRGGSAYLHEQLAVGARIEVGEPRMLFGLEPNATSHVFIAGGIGITPILSMIRWCEAQGQAWTLLYCVRSRARAAYAWELARHGAKVRLHVDEEAGAAVDLPGWLAAQAPGTHVYCCGPSGLMDAVAASAAQVGIPGAATHFERFTADKPAHDRTPPARSFTVRLKRAGLEIQVGPEQSLLEALEASKLCVPSACREGLCRSCELSLLEGEADHRDFVLSEEERAAQRCILPCVSRARSAALVIDL